MLQSRQKLKVTGIQNAVEKDMGTFYLDKWENVEKKTMKITAIDLIGVIDKMDFMGNIYFNVPFENIVNEIMISAGLTADDYTIQNSLRNIMMSGFIPICSHRQALQQVLFAVGACADCSRSDKINIFVPNKQLINNIQKTNIFHNTMNIKQNDLVTSVEVLSHNYAPGTLVEELYKGELDPGQNKILFSDPVHNLTITGGTIVKSNCNFAIVNCTTTSNVVISGRKYLNNSILHSANAVLDAQQKEMKLTIDNAYFVNRSIAMQVAQRILDYYQKTFDTSFDYLIQNERIGDYTDLETEYEQKLVGNITRLNVDLLGGWITNIGVHTELEEE